MVHSTWVTAPKAISPKLSLPKWASAVLVAASLTGIYLVPTFPILQRFSEDTSLVARGDFGDQSIFVWMIARAKRVSSFSEFVTNCDWSDKSCFDVRSIAVELNTIYGVGRAAKYLDMSERTIITFWYFANLFLCLIAAFFFIWVVSDNLWAAVPLAGLVSFQQTLIQRIQGHMMLVTWWASAVLLALEWLCLKQLCFPEKPKPQRAFSPFSQLTSNYLLPILWALCLFVTVNVSFYHTLFVALLAPPLFAAFLYANQLTLKSVIRKPGFLRLAVIVTLAAVPSLYSVSWAFVGGVNKTTYYRTDHQVSVFSPRIQDYFLPNVDASKPYAWLQPLHLANDPSRVDGRLEVLAYLGFAFLLCLLFTFIFAKKNKDPDRASRMPQAFLLLFILTAFLGSEMGGLLVHEFVKFARCYNRMAPYVVLFGCAYMALIWRRSRAVNRVLPVVVFLLFCWEYRGTSLLSPDLLRRMDAVDRLAGQMKEACRSGGSIRLDPENADYMMGPLGALYAAEISRCRLDGVLGPGARPQTAGFVPPPSAAKLVWPGEFLGADPQSFNVRR